MMWTDVFQMIIIFVGLVGLVVKTTIQVGGFDFVWETARKADKLNINK